MMKTQLAAIALTSLASLSLFLPSISKPSTEPDSISFKLSHATQGLPQPINPQYSQLAPVAVKIVTAAPVAPVAAASSCGDNQYANYIYMHESGCRTNAVNPIGACGIGQALPCAKMGCSLGDYACQNAYFTQYANSVYGGWAGAYSHWLSSRWW